MQPIGRLRQFLHDTFRRAPASPTAEQVWWMDDECLQPAESLDGPVVQRVIDNRVMLLGLDELYRTAMKAHERTELLRCAERVAGALGEAPAEVPVEGYYTEHPALTTYFRLMRALQAVPLARAPRVESMPEFRRLLAVTSSPIFGRSERQNLLPTGIDPLTAALRAVDMVQWSVPHLTAEAAEAARAKDDISLVGLAARAEDPVVLAALRESVVLYAGLFLGRAPLMPRCEYLWQVDPALAAAAQRFVDAYNGLFGVELPPPTAEYARIFWDAFKEAKVVGRCARLGQTDPPVRYYHWAVRRDAADVLSVHEFWHQELFTTERYRRGDLRSDS